MFQPKYGNNNLTFLKRRERYKTDNGLPTTMDIDE